MDLKELLGEELFNKVQEKLNGKKLMVDDDNFVPLAEVNKKIAKVEAEKDVEINNLEKQLTDTRETLTNIEEDIKDNEVLKTKFEELKQTNLKTQQELENVKFNTKLDAKLKELGARNPKAVKPFLNLDDEELFDKIEDEIAKIKEDQEYLFVTKKVKGRDENDNNGNNDVDTLNNPFKRETRNLTKQGQLIKKEPEKARALIKSAGKDPSRFGL